MDYDPQWDQLKKYCIRLFWWWPWWNVYKTMIANTIHLHGRVSERKTLLGPKTEPDITSLPEFAQRHVRGSEMWQEIPWCFRFQHKAINYKKHGDGSISLWGGFFAARSVKPLKAEEKIGDVLRKEKSWRKSCCNWQEHWDIQDGSSFSRTTTWNIEQKPHQSAKKGSDPEEAQSKPRPQFNSAPLECL